MALSGGAPDRHRPRGGVGVYLVAMNSVFLWSPLFAKVVNAKPLVVDVRYERAWSWLPERIHAKGLSIRATDNHVEWIRFDDVDFDVSLSASARRRFHVLRARGSGLSFRLRLKVPSPAETAEHDRLRPPIDADGLSIEPDVPPYVGTWDDAKWHLWTYRSRRRDRRARSRGLGRARARDGRRAHRRRLSPEAAPPRADRDVRRHDRAGAALDLDGEPFARDVAGTANIMFDAFDPDDRDAWRFLLRRLSLSTDVRLNVVALGNPAVLPWGVGADGAALVERLALDVDHGVVRDGTRARASHRACRALHRGGVRRRRARDARARRRRQARRARRPARRGTLEGVARVGEIATRIDARKLDLGASPLEDAHAIVNVDDARVPDLAKSAALFSKGGRAARDRRERARRRARRGVARERTRGRRGARRD